MSPSQHSILLNAFRPAKEVDDPEFFAGRANEVTQLTDSLHVIGSCPIIYGDRGLGKTSLALQIKYIAMGDGELLTSLGIQDRALDEDRQYLAFFVTCTDTTQSFKGLIRLLINAAEDADFGETVQKSKATSLTERTISRKITLKVFEAESVKKYEREKGRQSYKNLSRTERLLEIIRIIVESYDQPVLFIIDELDRLRNTRGLASFIKAASSEQVKFILVGIASNISRLLVDHRSLERSLIPVRICVMNEGELYEIVEKAEVYLREQGVDITFDHFATLRIVAAAAGFPWFVHVIGQSALLLAAKEHRKQVVEADVILAMQTITRNQFALQFGDMYRNIVRNSYQRETVLRAFAEWQATDIPTSEVYWVLKERLGVTNPSSYKTQLASRDYGRVIYAPQFRNRAWIRFSNEMFKVYVRLRPSIYTDVDKNVKAAAKEAWN
jgi:Cdc6-like AAA superfamily ATPase